MHVSPCAKMSQSISRLFLMNASIPMSSCKAREIFNRMTTTKITEEVINKWNNNLSTIYLPVMCDAGECALGEDGVHLRPHLRLGLQEVLCVPYPNLAVVAHGEQSVGVANLV